GYTRRIGKKVDFSSQLSSVTQMTNGAAARTVTLTTSLTRRFSNVVALRVTAARTHQTGAFTANGTSFSADLVGPLAFGAIARTDGKGNPNLPATVRGHVYLIPGNDFTAAAGQQRGFGNVRAGLEATISIDTTKLVVAEAALRAGARYVNDISAFRLDPEMAGLVADRQNQAFRVGGGQVTTVDFGVGQFAGIAGRVTTQSNGTAVPLADVDVIIDDLQRTRTGPDGRYSVGRLKAGAHKVAVLMESLPASVTFSAAPVKTVQAVTGTVTAVDFTAAALGSIGGVVLYTPENGFGDLRGARDVYVVANPGDHAAITGPDGAFLLDNLPAGNYQLSLDPETLPEGQTAVQGPDGTLALVPGGKIEGISFKLRTEAKEVVFTFNGAKKAPFSVTLDPTKAPPGALINIVARTSAKNVKRVGIESDLFAPFGLVYDKLLDAWTGAFVAPERQKGEYALQAALEGTEKNNAVATLAIDNGVPLVSVRILPAKPQAGQTARVIAKILAPAEEGDDLRFQDGYTVKLPKPKGRVFAFDIRVWSHGVPYAATITSKKGVQTSFMVR
ncbi:MAG: dihydropteroate synthase, partial [Candidatus Velthaea sp.]